MPIARFQLPDGRVARFDVPEGTTPEQAQSMIKAHLPQMAQPEVSDVPEPLPERPQAAPMAPEPEQTTWEKVRPYVAPAVEALGAGGGALVGGAAGSVVPIAGTAAGGAAGAGLGYGLAKEALEVADVYLGKKAPRQGVQNIIEPTRNVLEGAVFEMGGRAIPEVLNKAIGGAATLPSYVMSKFTPSGKAAKLATNALGPDLPQAMNALAAAQGKGLTAAQATADINSPTWQALVNRMVDRDPRFITGIDEAQRQESLNILSNLAGGRTAADVTTSVKAAKQAVRDTTTPMREAALEQASQGLKPLQSEPLVKNISEISTKPEFAGNDVLSGAIRNVVNDISKWTDESGVVNVRALDAIRKNSVNAAIQQLRPGLDASSQKNLAAGVLSRVKPAIDDAIEAAGGTGYKEYLAEHAKLSQQVAEKQLTGEALELWKNNKDAFVKLVQNESPETVEKILGPGKYDIAAGLASDTMAVLESEAAKVIRNAKIKSQVTNGEQALKELLTQNISRFRIPSYLSAVATTTNKVLSLLENKIGKDTLKILTESLKTPEGAKNLLESLPTAEKNRVTRLLANPKTWSSNASAGTTGAAAAGVNMLSGDQPIENQLIN